MILLAALSFTVFTASAQFSSNSSKDKRYTKHNSKQRTKYVRKRSAGNNMLETINQTQRTAREKIAYGIIYGNITGLEAKKLLDASEAIEVRESRYVRNGKLSKHEFRVLNRDLTKLFRQISKERNNMDISRAYSSHHRINRLN